MDAVLRPDVLPSLIELIQKNKVPAAELAEHEKNLRRPGPPRPPGPPNRLRGNTEPTRGRGRLDDVMAPPPEWDASTLPAREKVATMNLEEFLGQVAPKTFPEKILALGAWLAARRDQPVIRPGDLKRLLVRLRQEPPANPGRDFRQAKELGWLMPLGHREFALTNAGWHQLAGMLAAGEGLPKGS